MTYPHYDRLISFESVHQAVKAEKVLDRQGIAVAALPTPREIAISCGQCLLFVAGRRGGNLKAACGCACALVKTV
ncbi:DUF3343 domain-containing protein [Sporomusa aerivorans]|uniref:DUF3343 domain-containing protein n=1 Tax=Sporomusa aerivorans TaxID=204936 RepID=UPI00352B42F6